MHRYASLFLGLALPLLGFAPAWTLAAPSASPDTTVLRGAAVRLGHQPTREVLLWLRRQPSVQSAVRGRDGVTVAIRFADGQEMYVLPAGRSSATVSLPALLHRVRGLSIPHQSTGARALVLSPFASELGVAGSGDIEADDLQRAGFTVDQLRDTAVTVASMARLPAYNVVYMHTHSGTTSSGDGIVATGQLATGDPSVAPLVNDGSVVVIGVAGSNNQYYAITSRFVTAHMAPFPHDSLVFLNGCKLLPATVMWQTMLSRGVGVFLSWDEDAQAQDDFLSAASFFNFMGQGMTVDAALQAVRAAGFGTSQYNGTTATLGYKGDGSITLSRAAGGQKATPTATALPVSTHTPTPTATGVPSTATPVSPTSTATAPAVTLRITQIRHSVAPGARQEIAVQTRPNVPVSFTVTFPSGKRLQSSSTADASGAASFSYVQPKNSITRHNRQALIAVEAGAGTARVSTTDRYTVRFATVDISVEPRQAAPRTSVAVWVHAHARSRVTGKVIAGKKAKKLSGKTGTQGWVKFTYRVPATMRSGQSITVTVKSVWRGKSHKGRAVLHVR